MAVKSKLQILKKTGENDLRSVLKEKRNYSQTEKFLPFGSSDEFQMLFKNYVNHVIVKKNDQENGKITKCRYITVD